jgi:hypothetical protein
MRVMGLAMWLVGALTSCGSASKSDAVIGDEELFAKEVAEGVEYARDECPAFAEAAGAQAQSMGAQSTGASLQIEVPESGRPALEEVTTRHGPPDSTAEDIHYYGGVGFRTESGGEVVEITINCLES